jgi:6-phosphogluconolactonase
MSRCAVYNSVGDAVTHWDLDPVAGTLTRRETVILPSVVQYGWPHPSNRWLYLASSDSERGSKTITGSGHYLTALRVGPDGSLAPHGAPQVLRQRAIHTSVDRDGRHVLTCYNAPSHVSVHPIGPDGLLGDPIAQDDGLDLGVFCHQIQAIPSHDAVLMVARGHNPGPAWPQGAPGALKRFGYRDGRLVPGESVTPHAAYGPRHAAFHPQRPWLYVLVELQHTLHMHRIEHGHVVPEPDVVIPSTQAPPQPGIVQVGGAIHVHPRGHVVYATNRVSTTTHPVGAFPFVGGENTIAVFAIDPATGAPRPIQFADPHGFHVRAFTIDPTGTVLIAAMLAAMTVEGRTVPAGLCLFRIADDGRLTFLRRYDIDLAPGVQQMWVKAIAVPDPSMGEKA